MPNQPKTPARAVRVPDELWESARARAAAEGRTLTDVIRAALRAYTETMTATNGRGGFANGR